MYDYNKEEIRDGTDMIESKPAIILPSLDFDYKIA